MNTDELPYKSERISLSAITRGHSIIQKYIEQNTASTIVRGALRDRELNKTTLALLAGVGYSVVHRTDLFLYDTIPPKLKMGMQLYNEQPYQHWSVEYTKAKVEVLHLFQEAFQNSKPLWLTTDPDDYTMTWTEWRQTVGASQMEFAKKMLINPAIIQHFEEGITQNLPVVIKERLLFFGMEPRFVAALNERMT